MRKPTPTHGESTLSRRRRIGIALTLVLAAALAVRLVGIEWGMPGAAGEMTPIERAWSFWNWGTGEGIDLNPHDFGWPSFVFYAAFAQQAILYGVGHATGRFPSTDEFRVVYETDPTVFVTMGRFVSTAVDLACIVALFLLTRALFGPGPAVAAALVLALDLHHVAWSQNTGPEVWVALFVLLASRQLLRVADGGGRRAYVLFGVLVGLGAATKYTPALLLASLPVAHLVSTHRDRRGLLLAPVACAAAFFLASPFVVLDPGESLFYTLSQANRLAAHAHFGQESLAPGWIFYLTNSLPEAMGPMFLLMGLVGLGVSFARAVSEARRMARGGGSAHKPRFGDAPAESGNGAPPRSLREAVVFLFPLLYFLAMGAGSSKNDHYMLPMTPFLAAAGAGWMWRLARPVRTWLPWAVVLAGVVFPAIGLSQRYQRLTLPDTRHLAREWIEETVPVGTLIVSEFGGPELLTTHRLETFRDEARYRDIAPQLLAALGGRPAYALVHLPLYTQEPEESAPFYEISLYDGFEAVILSSEIYRRYRRDPERFARQIAFYDQLERFASPLREFSEEGGKAAGPTIRVFALRDAVAHYRQAGGPSLPQAWELVRRYGQTRAERGADFAIRMGRALDTRRLSAQAAYAWRVTAELDSDNPEAFVALGGALQALGDEAGARAAYERALQLEPRHRGALNNLGGIALRDGRPDAARRFFQAALESDPAFPDAHANLGWLLLMEDRDTTAAVSHFEEAIRLAPANPQTESLREVVARLRGR